MNKEKILLISPVKSSFVLKDKDLLSEKYDIVFYLFKTKHKILLPFLFIKQFFIISYYIFKVKRIVVEFGGYVSVIPTVLGKLFGVPVFIVLHGTDCASLPEVNYGILRKKLLRLSCKISYKLCTLLLPVSKSLIYVENSYNKGSIKQGVKNFFPNIKTPFQVIHNGIDSNFWQPIRGIFKEEKTFLAVFSESQFYLKGGDLILDIAKEFTDCQFFIAGCHRIENKEIPENVIFLGRLTKEELRRYYTRSQFYFQLSMFEGFGLALCEAMLCNCIPIGSSVNIIPDIIGELGYILKHKDVKELIRVVEKALSEKNKESLANKVREKMMNRFSLDKRKEELLLVLSK